MKHIFIAFLLVVFGSLPLSAQTRNYDQELTDLLYGKRIAEAIDYYAQYEDSINHLFVKDSYKLFLDIYRNKPDNVFLFLPSFLEKYYEILGDDGFSLLFSFYSDAGDFDNGLKMLDIMELFFTKRNEKIKKSLNEIARLKNCFLIPNMEIRNNAETETVHIPIKTEPLILFDATMNTIPIQTIFDTGCSYPFFTDKKHADKIGVKIMEAFGMNMINGEEMLSAYGVIDSIRIGSLLIKNASVLVVEGELFKQCIPDSIINDREKMLKWDSINNQIEIFMGLPIIKMLNHIQFDLQKNEMILSLNRKDINDKKSNMYIESGTLYIDTKVNNMDFTASFDTGGNWGEIATVVTNKFYQINKDKLPVDLEKNERSQNLCWVHDLSTYSFCKPISFNISIGDNSIDLHKETIILNSDSHSFSIPFRKDGYLSLEFLKQFQKLTFDFHVMRMDGEIK